ncbi:MAG: hypothetical protein ACRDQX_13070 [Pseudonocardiaceae bacterium]
MRVVADDEVEQRGENSGEAYFEFAGLCVAVGIREKILLGVWFAAP